MVGGSIGLYEHEKQERQNPGTTWKGGTSFQPALDWGRLLNACGHKPLWSDIPRVAMVSHALNIPQHDMRSYAGPCIIPGTVGRTPTSNRLL